MKLLWDCIASEFGGRHELYEINYGGRRRRFGDTRCLARWPQAMRIGSRVRRRVHGGIRPERMARAGSL
jgi:hypothetical protein